MRTFRFTKVRSRASAFGVAGVALFTITGCVSLGTMQGETGSRASPTAVAPDITPVASPIAPPPSPFSAQGNDMLPRMIIPATGGTPVLGIPLGGSLFLPAAGGAPVIGIPLEP